MQAQATSAAVCPECGTRLEGGFSRGLGRCMICLLRVGFDDAEEPNEAPLSSVTDRLGNYRIERRDDGSLWELGRGAMGVTYRAVDTSLNVRLRSSSSIRNGRNAERKHANDSCAKHGRRHLCGIQMSRPFTISVSAKRTGSASARWNWWKAKRWRRVFAGPGRLTRSRPSTSPCRSAAHWPQRKSRVSCIGI